MIRKLDEKDRKSVLEFLSEESSINLFIIGDIEAFGFDEDFQEVWGQFGEDGSLEGVLLRFNENFIPYWKNQEFDITGFSEIILNTKNEKMISGKKSIVTKFKDIFEESTVKSMYFCEMEKLNNLHTVEHEIKIADVDDSDRIYHFIEGIEEFSAIGNSVERIKHKIETNTGRIYYMENEKGEIISVSQTTAENSLSAMIVGVATKDEYRGTGLMTKCLSKLCEDVLKENKKLCLFYDNPKAGAIYHKLGFVSIDNWMMLTEKK